MSVWMAKLPQPWMAEGTTFLPSKLIRNIPLPDAGSVRTRGPPGAGWKRSRGKEMRAPASGGQVWGPGRSSRLWGPGEVGEELNCCRWPGSDATFSLYVFV